MIRVAVAGAGAWGVNHVRAFATQPACKVAWVCDPDDAARRRATALVPSARTARDLLDALADDAVDAVVIASPATTHADLACRALAAGKHVLVEKPLALSVEDAERVARAAASARRVVLVGHLMVYHPALVQLRELLRSGELGQLRHLHATRVNLGRLRRDENVLWSFGPHDLSMLDYLLGELPVSVSAHGEAYLQRGIEDVVVMTLRYAGSVMGHVHLSWLHPRKERRLTVVGSKKMAEIDDVAADKLRIFDRGYDRPPEFTEYGEYLTIRQGGVHIPGVPMTEPLRIMVEHFLDCCRGQAAPRTDVESGIRIVSTLSAATESLARCGVAVEVTPRSALAPPPDPVAHPGVPDLNPRRGRSD
jgi:predicted dehydrogenase